MVRKHSICEEAEQVSSNTGQQTPSASPDSSAQRNNSTLRKRKGTPPSPDSSSDAPKRSRQRDVGDDDEEIAPRPTSIPLPTLSDERSASEALTGDQSRPALAVHEDFSTYENGADVSTGSTNGTAISDVTADSALKLATPRIARGFTSAPTNLQISEVATPAAEGEGSAAHEDASEPREAQNSEPPAALSGSSSSTHSDAQPPTQGMSQSEEEIAAARKAVEESLKRNRKANDSDPAQEKKPRQRIVFDLDDKVKPCEVNKSEQSTNSPASQKSPDRHSQGSSADSSDAPAKQRSERVSFDSSFNSNISQSFSPSSTPPHSQQLKRFNGHPKASPLSISRGLHQRRFKRAPTLTTVDNRTITAFFTKAYCFSNHFECDRLEIDGVNFVCTEQYYMYWKARLFDDNRSAKAILKANNPKVMKKIGSGIANFDQHLWNDVMAIANYRKYEQNADLRQELFSTGDSLLVEASPMDKRWGIGVGLDDVERLQNPSQWRGLNILGRLLTKIRDRLAKRAEFADEARQALDAVANG